MGFIKKLIAGLIGKRLRVAVDGRLEKWDISKEKIVGVLAILLPVIEPLSQALGHPVKIGPDVYAILAGMGFWAKRDRDDKAGA
jgi:hypothetical protein